MCLFFQLELSWAQNELLLNILPHYSFKDAYLLPSSKNELTKHAEYTSILLTTFPFFSYLFKEWFPVVIQKMWISRHSKMQRWFCAFTICLLVHFQNNPVRYLQHCFSILSFSRFSSSWLQRIEFCTERPFVDDILYNTNFKRCLSMYKVNMKNINFSTP